jgi:hypothetical protein
VEPAHLCPQPRLGACEQGRGHGGAGGRGRPELLPVRRHSQGLLPRAGQRTAECGPARGPEHFIGGTERKAAPGGRHHSQGPGGRFRGGLCAPKRPRRSSTACGRSSTS